MSEVWIVGVPGLLNLRTCVLQNIQTAADAIGNVNQTVDIDIKIVEHRCLLPLGRGRDKEADFFGTVLISDIENPQTGIVIGDEDYVFALKRTGSILMGVMRAEAQAAFAEV